ncbi:hypothetical protein NHX12_034455 [Muraenolepis orangiensis]|uniref:BTB domain-containing protein n=1 Tax=Muraenolepis orangiensis TaxID=630683 RepID=A0A9Q0D710_9TELE|nr:hypothetical protein NHX12_034455 [Muraenolepis orangiensis]
MDEQQDVDGVGQAVGAERTMSARTCNIFNKLRLNGELCDLVIEAEGVAFNAHKIILCGCSPYFSPRDWLTLARAASGGVEVGPAGTSGHGVVG